jgi:hypothetical protein
MAAKTFFRSMVGASMPMWIPPVYAAIGHWWAGSIFAFLSVAMAPSKSFSNSCGIRSQRKAQELTRTTCTLYSPLHLLLLRWQDPPAQ